jgi:hypothetical protein
MKDELQRLVQSYGLDGVTVVLVPSVHDWARAHSIPSNDPFRQASLVRLHDGSVWIVVLDEVTSDHPGQTTLFMHIEPDEYAWIVADLRRYARHLVLHEIGHAVLQSKDEAQVDRWTVPELRKLEGG